MTTTENEQPTVEVTQTEQITVDQNGEVIAHNITIEVKNETSNEPPPLDIS